MCWLSPARRSLSWIQSLLIELWLLVTEVSTLSLILLTTQTMVITGILPLQGKIPMVEPGIEPGTSWLVVRSCDHETTRLVPREMKFHAWDLEHVPTSVLRWPLDYVTDTEINRKIFPILFCNIYSILLNSFCYL